jgi:hypothetical protein
MAEYLFSIFAIVYARCCLLADGFMFDALSAMRRSSRRYARAPLRHGAAHRPYDHHLRDACRFRAADPPAMPALLMAPPAPPATPMAPRFAYYFRFHLMRCHYAITRHF